MTSLLPSTARSAIEEARQAHVAVETTSGPHVTPGLFALSDDRVWIACAVTTVKAKALARSPHAGVSVSVPGRTVVLQGPVERFDPRHPISILGSPAQMPALARGMARYGLRNAPDLLAFAGDLAAGRLGRRPPPLRAAFAVRPESGVIIEGGAVVDAWGRWQVPSLTSSTSSHEGDDRGVVIGLPGPLALPAVLTSSGDEIRVATALLPMLPDLPSFPIAWVADAYMAPGPAAKRGRLGRGIAHRTSEDGRLRVCLDRLIEWEGIDTSSAAIQDRAAPGPTASW